MRNPSFQNYISRFTGGAPQHAKAPSIGSVRGEANAPAFGGHSQNVATPPTPLARVASLRVHMVHVLPCCALDAVLSLARSRLPIQTLPNPTPLRSLGRVWAGRTRPGRRRAQSHLSVSGLIACYGWGIAFTCTDCDMGHCIA